MGFNSAFKGLIVWFD